MLTKYLNRFSYLPLILIGLISMGLNSQIVSAEEAISNTLANVEPTKVESRTAPPKTSDVGGVTITKDAGYIELEKRDPEPMAKLSANILVPHNINPVETFVCYPYPVKPPRMVPQPKLPIDRRSLKEYLLNSGYITRIDKDKPYPLFGWRWQYAYQAAVKRSGLGVPHTILTMYPWCDQMVRYVLPEVKKLNDKEDERISHYFSVLTQWEKNHIDIETESVRHGLYPMVMKYRGKGMMEAKLPVGDWWVTATHKVPGLTYYWQIPITAHANENIKLQFNEDNALVIQGGW